MAESVADAAAKAKSEAKAEAEDTAAKATAEEKLALTAAENTTATITNIHSINDHNDIIAPINWNVTTTNRA